MEHFGAVFKLDLTEETRTQLHDEEAIASSCLILATPMRVKLGVNNLICVDVPLNPTHSLDLCMPPLTENGILAYLVMLRPFDPKT